VPRPSAMDCVDSFLRFPDKEAMEVRLGRMGPVSVQYCTTASVQVTTVASRISDFLATATSH